MAVPGVKREILEAVASEANPGVPNAAVWKVPASVIELGSSSSSSSSSSDSDSHGEDGAVSPGGDARVSPVIKRRKTGNLGMVIPAGFLAPLSPTLVSVAAPPPALMPPPQPSNPVSTYLPGQSCRQFWKAGDFEGAPAGDWDMSSGGMDHVRVHPKFLHSNATSHKWALGAFAELLDNSLDEVPNGATFVNVDVLDSKKDGSKMLLVEDDGGGMNPEKMRHCMSLGYSAKSKVANTIGQYGNGFKTSTMRLGADVIVFSRCRGKDGKSPTQSIGLLSYTFLRSTGKEDIVVPMLDFERHGLEWKKIMRSSGRDWDRNIETIVQWSPFFSEADLLSQFNSMSDHGTRIIIYDLWEDDEGLLELDFTTDSHDIQLRGVNRDEKNIQMGKEYPNSRHFLTYKHSLRSYAAILYLRLPRGFRIILRGEDVQHHNIINDMMRSQEVTYKPQIVSEGVQKESNITAVVTIGFVKDAKFHIDVQGFNVYHKNRLIKPFWRLWNAAGSDGRGVIGVLEANFVEPAHDKQGFERTTSLARLEAKLIQMQKNYWSSRCHEIGYAPRRNKKTVNESMDNEPSDYIPRASWSKRSSQTSNGKGGKQSAKNADRTPEYDHIPRKDGKTNSASQTGKSSRPHRHGSWPTREDVDEDELLDISSDEDRTPKSRSSGKDGLRTARLSNLKDTGPQLNGASGRKVFRPVGLPQSERGESGVAGVSESALKTIDSLRRENQELKERLISIEKLQGESQVSQCEKCKLLEAQVQDSEVKLGEMNKEQETLVDIFSEERDRRNKEEESLRKKLKEASNTIQELLDKIRLLEKAKARNP